MPKKCNFCGGIIHKANHYDFCTANPQNRCCQSCLNWDWSDAANMCLKEEDLTYGTKRNCEKWEG